MSYRKPLSILAISGLLISSAFALEAPAGPIPSSLIGIENQAPPRLFVAPPVPGPLARGAVLIPYRVENFRIVPVLGPVATQLSPRVGHLHVTVDDLPWRWGDFSGLDTIVVTGLPAGEHNILIELADPEHRVLASERVRFIVPASGGTAPHPH